MQRKEIVIVVPIYREINDITERLSLEQLYRVLGSYDIIFVAPERMEKYCHQRGFFACFFKDRYFSSTSTYSELLLSDAFYAQFTKYEYMLVYQLDAFVFSDELLYFCELGYDYIGAPVPRSVPEWKKIRAVVGNGGLSLRKISSVRRILSSFQKICGYGNIDSLFYKYEDLFFGYCGSSGEIDFKVPDVQIALKFAVDENVSHIFQRLSKTSLPFGCHGWSRAAMYPIWRPFITEDKKVLSELDSFFQNKQGFSYRYIQWERVSTYIISRLIHYNAKEIRDFIYSNIDIQQSYIIWGYGKHGLVLHKLLKEFNYNIVQILDRSNKKNVLDSVPVTVPNIEKLKESEAYIIIAATDYDVMIKDELLFFGIPEQRMIIYRELLEMLVAKYVGVLWNKVAFY